MRFFSGATTYLWFKIALTLLVAAMIATGGRYRVAAIFAVLGFLLANGLTDVAKFAWPSMRPCQVLSTADLHGIGCSDNPGTASAHAANMAAVAFSFTYFLGRIGWIWIAVALSTGLSRIYVAAHYPSQVLFGWALGVLASFALIWTYRIYRTNAEAGEISEETPEGQGPFDCEGGDPGRMTSRSS